MKQTLNQLFYSDILPLIFSQDLSKQKEIAKQLDIEPLIAYGDPNGSFRVKYISAAYLGEDYKRKPFTQEEMEKIKSKFYSSTGIELQSFVGYTTKPIDVGAHELLGMKTPSSKYLDRLEIHHSWLFDGFELAMQNTLSRITKGKPFKYFTLYYSKEYRIDESFPARISVVVTNGGLENSSMAWEGFKFVKEKMEKYFLDLSGKLEDMSAEIRILPGCGCQHKEGPQTRINITVYIDDLFGSNEEEDVHLLPHCYQTDHLCIL